MDEVEKKCFNQETAELDFCDRSYLMDIENRKLLWLLVIGSLHARDSGIVSNEDADKVLKKLWEHKQTLIENKFPKDFFSKDAENFNIEAKCLAFHSAKAWPLPQVCRQILSVLSTYVQHSKYPEHKRLSFNDARKLIEEV